MLGFFMMLWAAITGAQAKKNLSAMQAAKKDYDKIDAKHAADKRSDDDVLKGGVR